MQEHVNPYSAPANLTTASEVVDVDVILPAGRGERFLNLLIDYFIQFLLSMALGIVIVVVAGEAGLEFIESTPEIFFGLPILLAYYILFEATTGRTIGKFVTGTKVVNEDGGPPSFGQILGRSFARIIPFEAFSFLGTPTRGWHDSLPKTYVVKCR